jgi:hypothetical protein
VSSEKGYSSVDEEEASERRGTGTGPFDRPPLAGGDKSENNRNDREWSYKDLAHALQWTDAEEVAARKRFSRMQSRTDPSRPNADTFERLMILFFGPPNGLTAKAKADRDELMAAHKRAALIETRQRSLVIRQPTIKSAPKMMPSLPAAANPWQFHNAIRHFDDLLLIGSKLDPSQAEPYMDPAGVRFHRRHIHLIRFNLATQTITGKHFVTCAAIAHTALRIIDNRLVFFGNAKRDSHVFAMDGVRFTVELSLKRTMSVDIVFKNQNWGWSPFIDERGRIHHGDSATPGSPYMIDDQPLPGKICADVTALHNDWKQSNCPYVFTNGGHDNGYLHGLLIPHDEIPLDGI